MLLSVINGLSFLLFPIFLFIAMKFNPVKAISDVVKKKWEAHKEMEKRRSEPVRLAQDLEAIPIQHDWRINRIENDNHLQHLQAQIEAQHRLIAEAQQQMAIPRLQIQQQQNYGLFEQRYYGLQQVDWDAWHRQAQQAAQAQQMAQQQQMQAIANRVLEQWFGDTVLYGEARVEIKAAPKIKRNLPDWF